MGYRNNIAILCKEKHKAIRGMTMPQLRKWYFAPEKVDPDDDYVPLYELSEEVYGMGKSCDLSFLKQVKKEIFDRPATNKYFNDDNEFYIIGKEGLALIIEHYRQKVVSYYEKILTPDEKDLRFNWHTTPQQHIERQLEEWKSQYVKPYNLDLDKPAVVSSWQFEYGIFELVRLYKTIDDDKFEICITGW